MIKKVLVTGVSGFLGKHIKSKLLSLGWDVYESNTKKANLMNVENLHCYNDIEFDYIFHNQFLYLH